MKTGIIIAALALSTVACGNPPSRGIVDEVQHTDAWIQIVPGTQPLCTGSGSTQVCTPGSAPQIISWPERWEIKISNPDESGWVQVDSVAFKQCKPGSNYPECTRDRWQS